MKRWLISLFHPLKQCRSCKHNKSNHCAVRTFSIHFPAHKSIDEVTSSEKTDFHFYPKSFLLHRVIDWSVEAGDLSSGKLVLIHLVKSGASCTGLTSIWNKVVSLWCKFGEMEFAHHLFDKMPNRDAASYNTLISSCMRRKCNVFEMVRFYLRMLNEGVKPNHITFGILISACGDNVSHLLLEVFHGLVLKLGFSGNAFVGSSIVDGCGKKLRLDDAVKAFDEIAVADLVSWNILIDACARSKSTIQAFHNFSRMLLQDLFFDEYTLTSVTKTCTEPKDLQCGLQIHCCVIKFGFSSATATGNSLITMYAKCEDGINSALKIFEQIHVHNVISWTAIITGLTQHGHNTEALNLYNRMVTSGIRENQSTFASIIPAISNSGHLAQGTQIHARVTKSSYCTSDVSVNNALIDMYSKCGNLDAARVVFEKIRKPDNVSYTTMITALGQHGMGIKALQILNLMKSNSLQPDDVTLLSCLSACSHSGLVHEGLVLFKTMFDVYSVKPRMEHFSCIVDMLGRAGKLNDAETFIYDMGLDSDVFVWEALLGACKLHGEVGLGERSAKKVMELEPGKHETYVLLSDVYASKELWKDKGVVRERLGLKELKKDVGGSWIN